MAGSQRSRRAVSGTTGAPGAHRSAAAPLALAWVALIVYASLYPFSGWRWPPGAALGDMLVLPWPRYFAAFDIVANLLGYMPLGFLLLVVCWRRAGRVGAGLVAALACGAALSYAMECSQHLLPQRVSSLLDWALNLGGAAAGALLGAACAGLGWLRRWQLARNRWFGPGSASATALLILWPVGLLFPAPVPLGLGQVGGPLRGLLVPMLADVDWAESLDQWLAGSGAARPPLPTLLEALVTLLGLLAPCLLLCAATRPGWAGRGRLIVGAAGLAFGVSTLSTALNFGPDHALAWLTPSAAVALGTGLLLALCAQYLPPRRAGTLALLALLTLVALVHAAPSDPYYAQSLHGWEQGRFVRFHGLAQWVGWLWPYAALLWLLARLGEAAQREAA